MSYGVINDCTMTKWAGKDRPSDDIHSNTCGHEVTVVVAARMYPVWFRNKNTLYMYPLERAREYMAHCERGGTLELITLWPWFLSCTQPSSFPCIEDPKALSTTRTRKKTSQCNQQPGQCANRSHITNSGHLYTLYGYDNDKFLAVHDRILEGKEIW